MDVHGLQGEAAGAGEAVPGNCPAPAKRPVERRWNMVSMATSGGLVNPAARLNVNLFARLERHFKDIAVAVQPEDAFGAGAPEGVNEKAGAAHQHVGHALDAVEGEIHGVGGGEELVLPDFDGFARAHVEGEDLPAPSRLKAMRPGPRA